MDKQGKLQRFVALRLGLSDIRIDLEDGRELAHATRLMLEQAQNQVDIFSRQLDPVVLERREMLAALRELCTRNPRARVRALVQQPAEAARRCPRLLELARRLDSLIELRQPHPDYRHCNEAFMIVDGTGLIERGFSDRPQGSASFNAPTAARRRAEFFTEVWERSETHPELRRLHL
ncbi:MAG TPA: hypothetical protein ENJ79_05865 [Gammaproteobacteria bacterium]|nr:hypothetical protein [Gammaproteobacteria bacterium]